MSVGTTVAHIQHIVYKVSGYNGRWDRQKEHVVNLVPTKEDHLFGNIDLHSAFILKSMATGSHFRFILLALPLGLGVYVASFIPIRGWGLSAVVMG